MEILELERLVVTFDREDLAEDPFQPRVAALFERQVGLEEPLVASRLDLRQVRNGKVIGDPAEVAFLGRDNSPHGRRCGHVIALLMGRRECKRAGRSASPDHSCTPRYPVAANTLVDPGAGQDEISVCKPKAACLAPPALSRVRRGRGNRRVRPAKGDRGMASQACRGPPEISHGPDRSRKRPGIGPVQ